MRILKDKIMKDNTAIKFSNGSFIAGDNKMILSDISIDYKNFTETRISIEPHSENVYLDLGQLSYNCSFVIIKIDNGDKTVKEKKYTKSYIEYSFISDITKRYRTSDILIFSSNDIYQIDEIYLSNVTDNTIEAKILATNNIELLNTLNKKENNTISGLVYNDIMSDDTNGKSSKFYIKDLNGRIRISLNYSEILDISINGNIISINTKSNENIELSFISEYHAIQGNSRMLFALDNSQVITYDFPSSDNTAPSINFADNDEYFVYTDYIIITKEMLLDDIVSSVYDYDDSGNFITSIDKNESEIYILDKYTSSYINDIRRNGEYYVYFKAKDRCGNVSTKYKKVLADR